MAKQGSKSKQSLDVQRDDESAWDYAARRRVELSSDGANSTYVAVPTDDPLAGDLVQQHRGEPGAGE